MNSTQASSLKTALLAQLEDSRSQVQHALKNELLPHAPQQGDSTDHMSSSSISGMMGPRSAAAPTGGLPWAALAAAASQIFSQQPWWQPAQTMASHIRSASKDTVNKHPLALVAAAMLLGAVLLRKRSWVVRLASVYLVPRLTRSLSAYLPGLLGQLFKSAGKPSNHR